MDLKSTSREQHRNVFVLSGGVNRGAVQVGMMEALVERASSRTHSSAPRWARSTPRSWGPPRPRPGRELRARWCALSTRDIFPGGTMTRVGHLPASAPTCSPRPP